LDRTQLNNEKRIHFVPPERSGVFTEGEHVFSLRDLLRVIQKRIWVVVLVAVICVGVGVGFSLLQTPMYESSIKILIGQERAKTDTPREDVADVVGLQQLTQTMAEGVHSRPVAESAIRQLNLSMAPEDLLANLRSEQVPRTQFVRVTYTDSSPQRAQQVANTLGDVFSKQVTDSSPSASTITATVWERAVTPDKPASPNPGRTAFLMLVLGLILGVGLGFLLERLDDRWRSPEEAERVSGVPTFGVIPEFTAISPKSERG
jgi:capsular polysaccharide biosynthesis protein